MMWSGQRLKTLKIAGLGLLCFLLLGAPSPIKKDQYLQQPIGSNTFITWGDLNELSFKINAAFVSMAAWFLIEALKAYQKSKDTTSKDIKELKEMMQKVLTELSHRPTWKDIHQERDAGK